MAKRRKKKNTGLGLILIVILVGCITTLGYKYFKIDNKKVDIKENTKKDSDVKPTTENNKNDNDDKKDDNKNNKEDPEPKKDDNKNNKEDPEPKKDDNNNKEKKDTTKKVSSIDEYPTLDEVSGEKVTIGTSSKGYTIYTRSNVTYVDGIMIVNKSYPLPEDYIPQNTHASAAGRTNTCNTCINEIAYQSFNKMKADASTLGLNIYIQSGYRPYSTQKTIYNRYVARDGKEAADTYSARPGSSEHQSGLCFDLNSISDAFANTAEGKWVNENAYLYGFIIRFPKGKQNYTGYKYESWHLRYVGADLAKELYNNGDWLSLEEYFGLDSEYKD